jgi:hypothetical protein
MQSDLTFASETERTLRFAFATTDCGPVLVLMSHRGVVDVLSANGDLDIGHQARLRYPGVTLVPDCGVHAAWIAAIELRFRALDAWGGSESSRSAWGDRCA